jgi:cob(I)alamin adenosyltransferase
MPNETINAGDGSQAWGKVQIYTGKGKGKTTAALGTGLRAHAQEKKVAFVYFDKGGEHYSEEAILEKLGVEYYRTGLDRIDPVTGKFRFGVTPEDKAEGKRGMEKAKELIARGDLDVLVLDEICISTTLGILDEQEALELIKSKPKKLELILTGRDAPKSFEEVADLVSSMEIKKHYFYEGEPAREGLDY